MSIALQSAFSSGSASGIITAVFGSNVTAGDKIIAIAMNDSLTGTFTISDTQGNVYTALQGPLGGTQESSQAWIATAGSTGACSVSINSSGTFPVLIIAEYPSSLGIGAVDQTSHNDASSGTALTSGSVTTTQAIELLISYGGSETNNGTFTLGSGWNMELAVTAGSGGTCLFLADQQVSSIGAYQGSATMSPSQHWFCSIITLKLSSAPPPSAKPVVCIMQ
jgi:hypothetical protein